MSKPQWKIDRERREAEERAKKEAEDKARRANMQSLQANKAQLDAQRAAADAADEARIKQLLDQRSADGVRDTKQEALDATRRKLAEQDVLCVGCGESLVDGGPFVRLGDDKRPYHRACLVCGVCKQKEAGIQLVSTALDPERKLICFKCRQAATQAPGTAAFCGGCGTPRADPTSVACAKCMRPYD